MARGVRARVAAGERAGRERAQAEILGRDHALASSPVRELGDARRPEGAHLVEPVLAAHDPRARVPRRAERRGDDRAQARRRRCR